ncbi:acyl-homoserine-lactone synthase [Sulfurovum sp. TSL1]|uniref:acyl-homoserine-lactone synthase n=1 Tax=Sulfurovum sp. TSL1 TaxID=2826994 RepID=UPI001CC3B344|nr:acyl-homoserine-lactone synthase [Sulfurovum sp. TSL1]GIT99463.1 hypothetical protein TSL1_22840 [Sulfurovum sp. TSL1]
MTSEQIFKLLTEEYTLVLATDVQDFQAIKQVRAEVFSHKYSMSPEFLEEKGYLFSHDDEQSFLYLLRDNTRKKYVGTVRVFFINAETPVQSMPMQKDGNVEGIEHLSEKLPICEVSRLALSNTLLEHKDFSAIELRTHLAMLLMVSTRINFFLYHYSTIFSIMEPSLDRILRRQGVRFQQIGDPVDYYGIRTPFAIERNELLKNTEKTMGRLTRHYLKDLCNNPEKFWEFIDNNPYLERSNIHLDKICRLFQAYGDDVDLSLLLEEKKAEPIA